MKILAQLFIVACLWVNMSSAATVWDPTGNGIIPPATGNWGDLANWTNGLPSAVEKAVFNVSGAADCEVSGTFSGMQIVQGDNGPGGVLRILNGGTITTKVDWSAVGYNDIAHTIVDAGGTYNFGQHAWIGLLAGANGTLDIYGTVNVGQMLGIGWNGGVGTVNVYDGGILNLFQLHADGSSSIKVGSLLNIEKGGQVLLPGDYTSVVDAYVANGRVAGNGVAGNVATSLTMNPGFTTIYALQPPQGNGDINGDGFVDSIDLFLFVDQWLEPDPDPNADFTNNGKVDMADFQILAQNWNHSEFRATLTGKIMCGYQGWFNAPGDGANRGWVHWGSGNKFEPGYCTVDWWPDMSEYDADEKFAAGFRYADGSTAHVFSSYTKKTVLRHFMWMEDYGIDGVFLQRF